MMMKRCTMVLVFMLLLISVNATSQDITSLPDTSTTDSIQVLDQDTINTETPQSDLNKISDLRSQFEKQNSSYSAPVQPGESLKRFIKKDSVGLSEKALYWARYARDASMLINENATFKDTVIVNPIFMTPLFKGNILPENLSFYNFNVLKTKDPYSQYYKSDSIFKDELRLKGIEEMAILYIEKNNPEDFRYTINDLPKDVIRPKEIQKDPTENLLSVSNDANFNDVSGPGRFIPERRYWKSNFESAIQFSQNHVSANWHKGGSSNLNVFTRNYLKYDYNKDKVQFANEVEMKLSFYNAPKDTIHDYKIGDDVLRLHSNLGYKAFNKWFYTFDAEFKTQLFTNYSENSTKQLAAFLSPFSVNVGVGMKYELNKSFKDKHKNLRLTVNLAPASFTYLYSLKDDIDLARHGFRDNKHSLSKFGSTVRTDLAYNISRNVNWQSRFYYFTSYDQVVGEFENTLTLAISRFFSTRIYLHLRFDDGVSKKENIDSYFQMNELLSFGFNYKW